MKSFVFGAVLLVITALGGASAQTIEQRAKAAAATASSPLNHCKAVQPFYWEIGDSTGPKGSASVGKPAQTSATPMSVASASKWIWGAYVVEKKKILSASEKAFLHMTSGYINMMGDCSAAGISTINECLASGSNAVQTPAQIGTFFYNSGHFENEAVEDAGSAFESVSSIALGDLKLPALSSEIRSVLGASHTFFYTQPLPAGGIRSTPADYGSFLKDIVAGKLRYAKAALGTNMVCGSFTCPPGSNAVGATPIPNNGEEWDYSMGHWYEYSRDRAYSSAGSRGFYPWIDSTKTWYGMVARDVTASDSQGYASAQCGYLIRQAWMNAKAILTNPQ